MSWQPLTCCKKLVDVGASLLSHQWTFADNYECIKISSTEYKVISLNQSCQSKVNGSYQNAADVLPKFLRIRLVHKANDTLYCSCKFFERMGIMCRHIVCVLKSIDGYNEPSHHDCAIRWWNDYMYYNIAYMNDDIHNDNKRSDDCLTNVCNLFKCLETKDITGPSCDSKIWTM